MRNLAVLIVLALGLPLEASTQQIQERASTRDRGAAAVDSKFGKSECEYIGDIRYAKRSVTGSLHCEDGSSYVGEWKIGKPHGFGTATAADGLRYVGNWHYGEQRGQGTAVWPDGVTYVCDWEGMQSGQGAIITADGRKYVGEFKNGDKHGKGTEHKSDGSVKRKRWWCNGIESDGPCPD